jgi:hypothetical protein
MEDLESAGASHPGLQRSGRGCLIGDTLNVLVVSGNFHFSKSPQGTPGIFKKGRWSGVYLLDYDHFILL